MLIFYSFEDPQTILSLAYDMALFEGEGRRRDTQRAQEGHATEYPR